MKLISVFDAQTEILLWLKSKGHQVDDPVVSSMDFRQYRSCESKKRFIEQPVIAGYRSYKCDYCGGWHLTTQAVQKETRI